MTQAGITFSATRSPVPDRALAYWLFCCCALVFAMVVIGGITRLTLSGLSITEWNPIMGAIPPLSEADWHAQFDLYKQTPQYKIMNAGMTLAAFKSIFWWEYIHRLLGRMIGTVFLLPLLYFAVRGRIERGLVPRLVTIFVLGVLQAVLGWFMVMSGLVERTSVSQYRLAAHLALALVIYAYMLWLAFDLLGPAGRGLAVGPAFKRARWLATWIFLVMLSGAFVAGLHAGFLYNTFPSMDGKLIPDGLFDQTPFLVNFFENVTTVQFDHRVLALATLALVILFWYSLRRMALSSRARLAANLLLVMVALQVALGVSTLLLAVPVPLAAAHQAGALVLFSLALWTAHELRVAER